MGPLVDLCRIWTDEPIFDAAGIRAPTHFIRGDLDFFADPGLLAKLTGAVEKREVILGDATYWAIYEKHREALVDETLAFLECASEQDAQDAPQADQHASGHT